MSPRTRTRTRGLAALATATLIVTLGGCASNAESGVTTLNFFQFKGEALEDFSKIIADFEAENPDIKVVQNQVADADTIIRTLLVKDKAPDVITLNANGGFGKLAQSGDDVVITFAGHDRLTIEHAHLSEFSAADFIF